MPKTPHKDLTGMQFGLWTVIAPAEPDARGLRKWRCRCSCGKERDVHEQNLLYKKSTSCGHTGAEKKRIDLTGATFGRLTVLEHVGYIASMHATMWRCRCSCGKEVVVSGNNLVSGHTVSCGCALANAQKDATIRAAAVKKSPKTGPFETNMRAKSYLLDNGKSKYEIRNLSLFVRNNTELFGISNDSESIARATKGLFDACCSRYRWNGWSVTKLEE